MARASGNSLRESVIPLLLVAGDTAVTFGGLALGYWLRYESPLHRFGVSVPNATFPAYFRLLIVGVALLLATFAQFGLYDSRLLLRRYQSLNAILKSAAFWFVAYLGISLALRFRPPISRLFVLYGFICVVALLFVWRETVYRILTQSPLLARLRRRTVLVGQNEEGRQLADELRRDPHHPYALVGWYSLPLETKPPFSPPGKIAFDPAESLSGETVVRPQSLGDLQELGRLLASRAIDVVIITKSDVPRRQLREIVDACERAYIEWKIVPGAFDIFLSGLHLQTIGQVPVLGVEELAINRLFNRTAKRLIDIIGALVGLIVSSPILAISALTIKRESSEGPILFRQQRIGGGHRSFTLWKLRTMRPDAAATDNLRQSTGRDDPRLLRCGAFLRRWNIDELPQFWNVLRGDMSLVGPRPERPYHVDVLAESIPHYLPRHVVKPGMTGWAQVNGLRGESDLNARIQHDIYYIENWSLWLDVQILLLTFLRWRDSSV